MADPYQIAQELFYNKDRETGERVMHWNPDGHGIMIPPVVRYDRQSLLQVCASEWTQTPSSELRDTHALPMLSNPIQEPFLIERSFENLRGNEPATSFQMSTSFAADDMKITNVPISLWSRDLGSKAIRMSGVYQRALVQYPAFPSASHRQQVVIQACETLQNFNQSLFDFTDIFKSKTTIVSTDTMVQRIRGGMQAAGATFLYDELPTGIERELQSAERQYRIREMTTDVQKFIEGEPQLFSNPLVGLCMWLLMPHPSTQTETSDSYNYVMYALAYSVMQKNIPTYDQYDATRGTPAYGTVQRRGSLTNVEELQTPMAWASSAAQGFQKAEGLLETARKFGLPQERYDLFKAAIQAGTFTAEMAQEVLKYAQHATQTVYSAASFLDPTR